MKYSPNELIMALKRVYVLIRRDGLTIEEFRDLRDCVQIAYENGAWRNDPEVIYKTVGDPRRVYRNSADPERVYKSKGDAIADIDAGVDDVFDKLEKDNG
jgi:hypothetical protein